MRITIPTELKEELLGQYGNFATDNEGHFIKYTEQDFFEQLRKKLRRYERPMVKTGLF